MRVQRQQFIQSQFMRMQLTSFEKKWVHHNRYHLQITLDKQNIKIKKKYSELKRFSQEVQKNLGVKNFSLQPYSRSNQQFKTIEQLVKRLNAEFLQIKPEMEEKEKSFKKQVRNYLYNMLFYNQEMVNFSDSDQEQTITQNKSTLSTAASIFQNFLPQISTPKSKPSTTNELKIDKSIKNKSMALAAQLVSTVLKKVQVEPIKEIFKNINIIWLKRGQNWHQCRLMTSQTSLILHDRHQHTKIVIILSKMLVYCCQQPYQRIILTHPLLKEKLQFRLSNINTPINSQTDPQLSDKYLAFYSYLKSLCHKQRMIETFNFIKIKINFSKTTYKPSSFPILPTNISNSPHSDKKTGKQIAIKLIHNTIMQFYKLSSSAFTVFPQYPCQIILPIVSNFGVIDFFSSEVKQNGVIPNFKQNIQNFTIPVQNVYDLLYNQKPKRKTDIQHINLEVKSSIYNLNLQYEEAGTWQTYYTCDTQNDKFQGNIQFDQPNKDELRIQFNRLKRIMWTIEQKVGTVKDWQHFSNPLKSYIFYIFLTLGIILMDMNYFLHYVIATMIGVMLYNHPSWQSYKKQVIEYLKLTWRYQQFLKQTSVKSKQLQAMGNEGNDDMEVRFKIDIQKKMFLDQFELRMKKKRNIYKKYKRIQQVLVKFQNVLMQVVNYVQKVKNIFTWYHHKKSKILYTGLIIALIVIFFFPIRLLLLIIVYKKFKKGKKYYQQTKSYNQQVVAQIMALTIREQKLDEMFQFLNNDLKTLNKKDNEYLLFEKKLKDNLQSILAIQYSPKVFQQAKNINQLKTMLSLCKKRYKIPLLTCRKYEINEKFAYKQSSLSRMILGFISVIPSDRNILGVKVTTQTEAQQKPEQIDQNKQQMDAFEQL